VAGVGVPFTLFRMLPGPTSRLSVRITSGFPRGLDRIWLSNIPGCEVGGLVVHPQPSWYVAAMKFFLLGLIALTIFVLIGLRLSRGRILVEASVPAGARKVTDVGSIAITLDIETRRSLFVLLSADGATNRMGRGTLESTEHDLFIGRTDPAIFEALRSHLTEAMLQRVGQTFRHQNPRGAPCKLTLSFRFNDSTSGGFVFLYGADSEGPPSDVAGFVTAAVRQTDSWYENFKQTATGRQQR
jgi:hypothetical protein